MPLRQIHEISAQHILTPNATANFEVLRRRKQPLARLDAALVKAARAAKCQRNTGLSAYPKR